MASKAGWLVLLVVLLIYSKKLSDDAFEDSGFCKEKIVSQLPPSPQWQIADRPPLDLLMQPFRFLGEGQQAYAFESADGKFVLKCFKMYKLVPAWSDYLCPHILKRQRKNLRMLFDAYANAYRDLREDTGLVFIHLAKTEQWALPLTLLGPKGEKVEVNLDETEFVLQRKAEPLFSYLSKLYRAGELEQMERAIESVYALIQERERKGYADRDNAVSNNYGFVGEKPILLDVGRLYRGSRPHHVEQIRRRVERWRSQQTPGPSGGLAPP